MWNRQGLFADKFGDTLEGYDGGWHAGKVVEIRDGAKPQYLLKYEKFAASRWHSPSSLRAAGTGAAEKSSDQAATAQGPRLGKYGVYAYGAVKTPPLHLGHVGLMAGGKYRISRTEGAPYYGDGAYRFNGTAVAVEWLSGPLATPEWGGRFAVSGVNHTIFLRSRTIATNAR